MPSWFEDPAYVALERELGKISFAVGASGAAVLDASGFIWCYACFARSDELVESVKQFHECEIAAERVAIKRGKKLEVSVACNVDARVDGYWARSFLTSYVFVTFFRMPFDEAFVRAFVKRAMPRIETLTQALPPPDGPRTTSGAQKQRA